MAHMRVQEINAVFLKELAMVILERLIQHIAADQWQALDALDKEYDAVESKHGVPAKKRYRALAGPDDVDTLIVEREWPSMAAMETAFEHLMADPEYQKVNSKAEGIVLDNRWEYYMVL